MKNLLIKEFKLSAHPTCYFFLLLPAMFLIPNYPYSVVYFYMTLAVFFTCVNGREYSDVNYMIMLPISRKDIVKARIAFSVLLQLATIILTIPFIVLRQTIINMPNLGGIDCNITLIGVGLLVYSIFNSIFFTRYYKNVQKVGSPFIVASVAMLLFVIIGEVLINIMPLFTKVLDTADSSHIPEKLMFDCICIILYIIILTFTYKKSVNEFSKMDIN